MNTKHMILTRFFIVGGLIALTVMLTQCGRAPKDAQTLTIGILQTASHPALDAARKGFVEYCTHHMPGKKVEFIEYNGQGSISQLHSMAKSLHANQDVDAVFAIATPAAQAMAHVEKQKPIFIAAVTDPQAAGLMSPQKNVCGTRDMIDISAEIDLLVTLVPHAHRVALLFSPAEVNSCIMVKKMAAELEARGLKPINVGITSENELLAAVSMACKQADALLAPTDNLVATTLPAIAAKALQEKKPLLVSDNILVQQGALAAAGIDYQLSGKQSAELAKVVLLEGKTPAEVGVVASACNMVVVNKDVARTLGVMVPTTGFKNIVKVGNLVAKR